MNHFISMEIDSCKRFLNSAQFEEAADIKAIESGVTFLIIRLHDWCQKAKNLDRRLSWTDHINGTVGDITDLISKIRNNACHIYSAESKLDETVFRFNVLFGAGDVAQFESGFVHGGEFEDDVAFFYGKYRIYLRRHMERALSELSAIFNDDDSKPNN